MIFASGLIYDKKYKKPDLSAYGGFNPKPYSDPATYHVFMKRSIVP